MFGYLIESLDEVRICLKHTECNRSSSSLFALPGSGDHISVLVFVIFYVPQELFMNKMQLLTNWSYLQSECYVGRLFLRVMSFRNT